MHICLIKTRTKEERVWLIRKDKFYKRLVDMNIKMKEDDHGNLSNFLMIDSSYSELFLVKKIARGVEAFIKSPLY